MDRNVLNYLENAQLGKDDPLTNVLAYYANGKFQALLLRQHVTKLEFFPSISKGEESLQISFQYYNLFVILEFDKKEYEYSIHTQNCSANQLEQSIVTKLYGTDFDVEVFFAAFFRLLKEDVRLIKSSQTIEKKKTYKMISSICFIITILIIAIPSVYVLITRDTIQLGPWFLAAVLVPFTVSEIFDFLAAKE